MIKFDKRIVQFGFGAVGKSFYEKVTKEIDFDENKYYVISRDSFEFEAFINMGGMTENFIVQDINKDNFKEVFEKYLDEGDLLIDFADTVGTRDILTWCVSKNVMYINTGEADWPENWYSIFNENELKCKIREEIESNKDVNKYPVILQHGNNPGLVSHFVKAGLEYIVKHQFKKDKDIQKLLKENKFNKLAKSIGLKMVHVNDIDTQKVVGNYKEDTLYSTWCIDSFWFEMLSEATMNVGTHENIDYENKCKYFDKEKGYLEFKSLAANTKCRTYYPGGEFDAFLVPHEETITIAKGLEVKENDATVYRPSVMFLYLPCEFATRYLENAKLNEYPDVDPDKPQDCETKDLIITRGYLYPKNAEILYKEKIASGTEYVGVLLIGDNFNPVWVGNRVEKSFLYKSKKGSYWQTPTITPVAMSALAAIKWMIKNKDKGGIYFPDDIFDYKDIIKSAEKYISKTIFKTFKKEELESKTNINFSNIQFKDIWI